MSNMQCSSPLSVLSGFPKQKKSILDRIPGEMVGYRILSSPELAVTAENPCGAKNGSLDDSVLQYCLHHVG